MKNLILVCTLLISFTVSAQINYMEVTNNSTKKVRVIQEHKRIVIFLKDGTKVTGRYLIDNDQGIIVKDQEIPLEAIAIIKRQSITKKVIGVIFLSAGGITLLSTVGILVGSSEAEFAVAPAITAITLGGIGYGLTKLNSYEQEKYSYNIKKLAP